MNTKKGISESSYIAKTSQLSPDVYVGTSVYIGENVKIGKNTRIHSHTYIGENSEIGEDTLICSGVKIYSNTKIGYACFIGAGTVIGSDGFGFAPQQDGTYVKVPQVGNVVIKDEVFVGANTVIDRATMGSTVIGKKVKLAHLVQIAHNVIVNDYTNLGSQSGISGSTVLGEHCVVANQSGVVGHLKIANESEIIFKSGLMSNIKKEQTKWIGAPATSMEQFLAAETSFKQLPGLEKRIEQLEKNTE